MIALAIGAGAPLLRHGAVPMAAGCGASELCNDEGNADGCAAVACPSLSCLLLGAIIADARTGHSAAAARWPAGINDVKHGVK
ncbi:MAG: hypothetical protein ACREGL_11045, partial [Alphaproteobacteria bacterium]